MAEELISAIITTYKGANTIERAVKSVLAQTYSNMEVIVVDDNGLNAPEQKETQKILEQYPSVRYIPHEQNKNGSAARNTGMHAANGEIIALLDDDDVFLAEKIEKQYKAMKRANATVCYTGLRVIFPSGVERDVISEAEGMIFARVMQREIEAPTSVLMFTKKAALAIGGFDESFRRHQDWEFLDRLTEGNRVASVKEVCLLRYIVDRNTAQSPQRYLEQRLYYLDKQKPYIEKLDKEEQKAVYHYHYAEIMRNYVKAGDVFHALIWFLKAGKPLALLKDSIQKYLNYRNRI